MAARDCAGCNFVQGNECIQYNGSPMAECGLVKGQWYKLEDLLAALQCAGFSTTTTTTSTVNPDIGSCMCMVVEARNEIYEQLGTAIPTLSYKLYSNPGASILIKEKSIEMGQSDIYTHFGAIDAPEGIFPVISANLDSSNSSVFDFRGSSLDLVIIANDIIRYARSLALPVQGSNLFPSMPVLPKGRIVIVLFRTTFDSISDAGQGLIAMGGYKLENSFFQADISLTGGGIVGVPTIVWPDPGFNATEFVYCDYDTVHWGMAATSMEIKISGINNELAPVKVEFSGSTGSYPGFTDTVVPGGSYERIITLSAQEAEVNDFMIRILK